MARTLGAVEHVAVVYGKVEREAEPSWVCGFECGQREFVSELVGIQRGVGRLLACGVGGEFGEVAIVVAFPVFDEKMSAVEFRRVGMTYIL